VNAISSLGIMATVVLGAMLFAFVSMRRITMSPQEYIVGGRAFGSVFLWVLLGGEIYTSFTFLGAAGWAYTYGAPAFYIMAYGACGFILYYFILPWVWRLGKRHNLLTSPDFFLVRYGSKPLATLVAVLQIFAIIPYVTLQIAALEIFLTLGGYGSVDAHWAAFLAFLVIIAFVFATGLHGTAWVSIVKDALVLGALVFVGIAIPVQFFGSPAAMFSQALQAHPHRLLLGGSTAPFGSLWYLSTVFLTGIGFFMGPQSIAAVYSAKDEMSLRRNAMLLPFYQVMLLLVFFAGFSALLIVPGLKGTAADRSFLVVVQHFYPSWVLGFIAAAGSLCALVPSTALLLSAASIGAKNLAGDVFGVATNDRSRVMLTRSLVAFIGLLALWMWAAYPATIGALLLLFYDGVSQLAPAFIFGFLWRRTSALGVGAGIVAGVTIALFFAARGISPWGVNPGFIGLLLNVLVLVCLSLRAPLQTIPELEGEALSGGA
jgi:SSS family solute:Na+ symporter